GGVIRGAVVQGNRNFAAKNILVDKVKRAAHYSAVFMQSWAKVAAAEQLVIQPASFEAFSVIIQYISAFAARLQFFSNCLGGEHAGFHRGMVALDFGEVQCARLAAN